LYPIELWNHYEDALQQAPKTTNCTEGFYNALISLFLAAHPSIWTFFNGLCKDMALHRLTVQNAQVGIPATQRPKYKRVAERLSAVVGRYPEDEIFAFSYSFILKYLWYLAMLCL
jgi:hypothetical protein